jgi:hypothetical protein
MHPSRRMCSTALFQCWWTSGLPVSEACEVCFWSRRHMQSQSKCCSSLNVICHSGMQSACFGAVKPGYAAAMDNPHSCLDASINPLSLCRSYAGCGPCRMIAPLIDEVQNEYKDRLKCVKLNTDESPQVATDYGIRSIPTVCAAKTETGTCFANAGCRAPECCGTQPKLCAGDLGMHAGNDLQGRRQDGHNHRSCSQSNPPSGC